MFSTCRACDSEKAVAPSNAAPYLAAVADASIWSLQDVLDSLCVYHRDKLDGMLKVGREIKGTP